MPNIAVEVDEGIRHIKSLIPSPHRVRSSDLRVTNVEGSTLQLTVGDKGSFKVGFQSASGLKKIAGLDVPMLGRLDEDLRSRVFSQLMSRCEEQVIVKVLDDQVVGFQSTEVPLVPYLDFIDRMVEKTKPHKISSIYNKDGKTDFGLVMNESMAPAKKVDDYVHSGLYVSLNGKATVQPYNLRLACTNGMTSTQKAGVYILDEENFGVTLDQAISATRSFLQKFISLDENKLGNSGGVVGHLSTARVLNANQVQRITQQLATLGSESTEYDLVNLITNFQHDAYDSGWLSAGGNAVEHLRNGHCSHCGSAT